MFISWEWPGRILARPSPPPPPPPPACAVHYLCFHKIFASLNTPGFGRASMAAVHETPPGESSCTLLSHRAATLALFEFLSASGALLPLPPGDSVVLKHGPFPPVQGTERKRVYLCDVSVQRCHLILGWAPPEPAGDVGNRMSVMNGAVRGRLESLGCTKNRLCL